VTTPVKTNSHSPGRANGSAGHLKRRVAPSVALELELAQADEPPLRLTFRLAFDFNAIAAAEEVTGRNMLKGDIWTDLTGATVGVLFWASLLAHQPEFAEPGGLEVARSYLDMGNILDVGHAVEDAFLLSRPESDRALARELRGDRPMTPTPTTTTASAGSNSGQSPDTTSA
jgi:hypothetical protein